MVDSSLGRENGIITQEIWKPIEEFPNYEISNLGNIYNTIRQQPMSISRNNFGHLKITLLDHQTGERYTRSVAQLVAEAFVSPPDPFCDTVVVLDGNYDNVAENNLIWRPAGFAWNYARQLRVEPPLYFKNLPVINVSTGTIYDNVVSAGINEGLLFTDIWYSTYTGKEVYPFGSVFEIVQ